MKRAHCLLSAAVLLALGVVGLAVPTREPPPLPAPSVVTEAPAAAPEVVPPVEVTLKRGETLEAALRRGGLERAEAAAVVTGLRGRVNMRRLAPGERLTVKPAAPEGAPEITWTRSPAERYEIRSTDGRWTVEAVRPDVETRVVAIAGEVRDSLFASVERLGETAGLTARLVSLFEWDFDFAADSLPGDRFRFLVEKRYVGDELLGYGDILVAQYASAGRPVLTSVAFEEAGGRADYFDASGRSVKKMFLRAPLDFTRVTSGFSHARHHPILGGLRPHLAVVYGAPSAESKQPVQGDSPLMIAAPLAFMAAVVFLGLWLLLSTNLTRDCYRQVAAHGCQLLSRHQSTAGGAKRPANKHAPVR